MKYPLGSQHRASLALAVPAAIIIISALLVNSLEAVPSIQDSLPSLVLDEEPQQSSAADRKPHETAASPAASKDEPSLAPNATLSATEPENPPSAADKQSKLIPYETTKQTSTDQPAQIDQDQKSKAPQDQVADAPTSPATSTAASGESISSAKPTSQTEKDISVLLANKNDAENDLAAVPVVVNREQTATQSAATSGQSPSVTTTATSAESPSTSLAEDAGEKPSSSAAVPVEAAAPALAAASDGKKIDDSDAPVDTNPPVADNDRFHYSMAGDKLETTTSAASITTTVAPSKPEPGQEKASPVEPLASEVPKSPVLIDTKLNEPVATEAAPTAASPAVPVKSTSAKPAQSEKPIEHVDTITSTTTSSPSTALSSSSEATSSSRPEVVASQEPAMSPIDSILQKERPIEAKKAEPATTAKPVAFDAAAVAATALGTALGAATSGKSTTTTTTTKAPTRKSVTDRWDKYNPSPVSTSTSVPPTRRRPILPSIRRRFRPYNRFSPFPWGGADPYSPYGGLEPDFTRDSSLGEPNPSSSSGRPFSTGSSTTSTRRPTSKRRSSSSTTTTSLPSEEDEEVKTTTEISTRRRAGGSGGKRRHQHHNHDGHDLNGRRRQHHHRHHHHSIDRDERPSDSPFDSNPFSSSYPRPFQPAVPGFGLFNSGASGSGFDLLNPFSGWLDDTLGSSNRPAGNKPPVRSPSGYGNSGGRVPPVQPQPASGGEFPSESHNEPHHHDHHDHHHDHHRERDHDYDHHHDDHHHDCHDRDRDHDYHNHRETYRPGSRRPPPAREPFRPVAGQDGNYDTYPPSRPGRPYNRREQDGSDSSLSAAVSPSLYNSAPAKPVGAEIEAPASQPPKRPSIFSPFDALFGTLDEELFGMRSSASSSRERINKPASFDTVVSSPKILMPAADPKQRRLSASDEDSAASLDLDRIKAETENGKKISPLTDPVDDNGEVVALVSHSITSGDAKPTVRMVDDQSPCSKSRGILCFLSQKPTSIFDLFRL